MIMKRTTIMLPSDLKARAVSKARHLGISLGELIRKSISSAVSFPQKLHQKDPLFEDNTVFEKNAPKDLASNHDDYLYGNKNK